MGIIIDTGRASLRFKGPTAGLIKAMKAIETVPLPENAKLTTDIIVTVQVGEIEMETTLTEFGETVTKIEMALEKLEEMGFGLDFVVPVPTPKVEEGLSTWVITVRQEK